MSELGFQKSHDPLRRVPGDRRLVHGRCPDRMWKAAMLLGGLLVATSGARASCDAIEPNDSASRAFVLQHSTVADSPLNRWTSVGGAGFSGCRTVIGHELDYQPGTHSLTYVRDVSVDRATYRAYQWGPATPLVIFGMTLGPLIGGDPEPIAVEHAVRLRTSAGARGRFRVSLRYRFIARGGAMEVSAPLAITASTTHRSAAGLGSIRHAHEATVSLAQLSCTLSDTGATLPDTTGVDLPSVGSTSTERTVQMRLTCPAFGPEVVLSLADANDSGNRGSVLSPAADATAAGVAIELLRDGNPVRFGQSWTHPRGQNGTVPALRLNVRYHRTSTTISPGTVKGLATLTANYR